MNWYEEKKDKKKKKDADDNTVYQSYVTLHRKDDFAMPVEVEIVFRDSKDHEEKVREHWDGQSRWIRFAYQKKSKLVSAEIDPDHTVHIDRNNFNNSYLVEPNTKATYKLTNFWMFLTQWIGQAMAWWAV